MDILVCVKRVPATGGKIVLTADQQEVDTRFLGFTISPHEECAIEEAIRIAEANGGSVTVLSLGPEQTVEQLRDAMAMGAERAILLDADGHEWDAGATARAIVEAIREDGVDYDLLLFGNESADASGHQVGVRVAHALGLPCVTGVKGLAIGDGAATARREVKGGWEVYEVPLPALITVKEGINLPRYPSLQGRLKAKKKDITRYTPAWDGSGLEKIRLQPPPEVAGRAVEVLGKGPEAAPQVVELLQKLKVM